MSNYLQPDKPLYLPEGSVRAILALAVVAAYIAGVLDDKAAWLVLGFYFGQKVQS